MATYFVEGEIIISPAPEPGRFDNTMIDPAAGEFWRYECIPGQPASVSMAEEFTNGEELEPRPRELVEALLDFLSAELGPDHTYSGSLTFEDSDDVSRFRISPVKEAEAWTIDVVHADFLHTNGLPLGDVECALITLAEVVHTYGLDDPDDVLSSRQKEVAAGLAGIYFGDKGAAPQVADRVAAEAPPSALIVAVIEWESSVNHDVVAGVNPAEVRRLIARKIYGGGRGMFDGEVDFDIDVDTASDSDVERWLNHVQERCDIPTILIPAETENLVITSELSALLNGGAA